MLFHCHVNDQDLSPQVPWVVVLSSQFQIRKHALRLIIFGEIEQEKAMEKAREDSSVKEKYFSNVLAIRMAALVGQSEGAERSRLPGSCATSSASLEG